MKVSNVIYAVVEYLDSVQFPFSMYHPPTIRITDRIICRNTGPFFIQFWDLD